VGKKKIISFGQDTDAVRNVNCEKPYLNQSPAKKIPFPVKTILPHHKLFNGCEKQVDSENKTV